MDMPTSQIGWPPLEPVTNRTEHAQIPGMLTSAFGEDFVNNIWTYLRQNGAGNTSPGSLFCCGPTFALELSLMRRLLPKYSSCKGGILKSPLTGVESSLHPTSSKKKGLQSPDISQALDQASTECTRKTVLSALLSASILPAAVPRILCSTMMSIKQDFALQ